MRDVKNMANTLCTSISLVPMTLVVFPLLGPSIERLHMRLINWASEASPTLGCSIEISRVYNWASEASPTLGCSIEISRDIYIYIYVVGMLYVCRMSN